MSTLTSQSKSMSLLLVVVLLFFSSSCSVSSHQYYVSDNCSSVTHTPCNPLSVYAGNMSQYNNSIFYFIGTNSLYSDISLCYMEYVHLYGLENSRINCSIFENEELVKIEIVFGDHVYFSNMSFHNCWLFILDPKNTSIINSVFANCFVQFINIIDSSVLSSVFTNDTGIELIYQPIECDNEMLRHYWLTITNVTLFGGELYFKFEFSHGSSYNISIAIYRMISKHLHFTLPIMDSIYSVLLTQSSLSGLYRLNGIEFQKREHSKNVFPCSFGRKDELYSFIVIDNNHINKNSNGLLVNHFDGNELQYNHTIIISSCLVYDNEVGSFIDGRFFNVSYPTIKIMDSHFIGNTGNTALNYHSIYLSNVTIANSLSTGLTLKGSIIRVSNNLTLRNNAGLTGGGIAINESSFVILLPLSSLELINNYASYKGGGIYADEETACPLQSTFPPLSPRYLTFLNNTAEVAGDDIYNIFNHCIYPGTITSGNLRSSSDATRLCLCNPKNTDIVYPSCADLSLNALHFFPGEIRLNLYVILFGYQYDHKSYSYTDGTVSLLIDDVLFRHSYINSCSLIEFTLNELSYGIHLLTLSVYNEDLGQGDNIQIEFTRHHDCPFGFIIDSSQGVCTCSRTVLRENVTCNITSLSITHNGLLWMGTYDTSTAFNAYQTNPNACIINEDCLLYCSPNPVTFQLNDTDTQCIGNRGQRICGSCKNGYSIQIGSNKCGYCDGIYAAIGWIALFAVMGLLLVAILIALNLTVSVGTLNGLLFYANIVKFYEPIFSRKGALPVLSQLISWINLDFGFEICFYSGMDSYAKQWLQFAFPFYLWMIIIIIILLCRKYGKVSRLMGSHAVPVLSTLFLLSYTKLVHAIVIVLNKQEITLHCTNESVRSVSVWDEDPNVEYAKGKHAVLFAFALLVSLFFIVPYTLFLLLDPLIEKYLSNFRLFNKLCWSWLKPIIDAYSGPMKDEYRFWPGILLVARVPMLLSVILSGSNIKSYYFLLCVLLTVIAILLSLQVCGVYKKKMNNIIEVWFLFNLCIMLGLSIAHNNESAELIWFNVCLSVFIASFFVIALYHFYMQVSDTKCCWFLFKKYQDYDVLDPIEPHKTVEEQMKEIVPTSTDVYKHHEELHESVVKLY